MTAAYFVSHRCILTKKNDKLLNAFLKDVT
jgi:hypothetical protein